MIPGEEMEDIAKRVVVAKEQLVKMRAASTAAAVDFSWVAVQF